MGLLLMVHEDDGKALTGNQLWARRRDNTVATTGTRQHWSGSQTPCNATHPVMGSHGTSRDDQKSVDGLDKYMAANTDPALLHDAQKYQDGMLARRNIWCGADNVKDLAHGVQSYA